ncbi:MBL fold metallo-hydrolase [Marinospirillum minutulum]|uniref:MBL fold metallo-hydrolase n=1 Tax=Marinospirillum minutulum TaxID=64974 RepID=UPI0003F54227|nr:MBL fold metallo-hydrolase [Marinospirillum minutulum]
MKVCIHRGSQQIGGSCVEVEAQGKRLLLDLGLPLDAEANTPDQLPLISGLINDDASLLGILISHPHLDHFGLLKHIRSDLPVGMGAAARRILKAAAPFLPTDLPLPAAGWEYQSEKTFEIGPFRVTPYLVDHSAYDAYGLLIEADGQRLFYSGDFRGHGRKSKLFERFVNNPPPTIDALLMEGSSLGRLALDQHFPCEQTIEKQLHQALLACEGLAMVHTSMQNIDRLVSIFRASKKSGRKLVLDLYSANVLAATNNPNLPQSHWQDIAFFVPGQQRYQILKNAWFDQLKLHSKNRMFDEELLNNPSKYTLLFRPMHISTLKNATHLDKALYVYSQWKGYWDAGSYDYIKDWLEASGIKKVDIHTSGHASPVDLKRFVEAVNPKKLVPIHSFHPEQYPQLFKRVETYADGQWWDVCTDKNRTIINQPKERNNTMSDSLPTSINSKYQRSLNTAFLNDLKEGVLQPLLERVKQDDTLMLALRGNYINIYYRGGALFKIEQQANAYNISFDASYEKSEAELPDYLKEIPRNSDGKEEAYRLLRFVAPLKEVMDRYFSIQQKPEREFQQLVVRENNSSSISNETEYFIIDIEAAGLTEEGKSSAARFDMLGVRWLSKERQKAALVPVLIEMKYGTGALSGSAGITKHKKDADSLLTNTPLWNKVIEDLEVQINQLDELGLLTYNRSTRVEKLSINREAKPELVFMLANYNPRSTALQNILGELAETHNPEAYNLLFATSSFMGYGLHSANMRNLTEFTQLAKAALK